MSKENGSFIKLDESPPKYPSKIKPTQEQMQTALEKAVKEFNEIDVPELDKRFHVRMTDWSEILLMNNKKI